MTAAAETARASSCGLFPIAYPGATDPLKNELRTLYGQLCQDASSMVRKATARNFGNFADTVERLYWQNQIILTFEINLTFDDDEDQGKTLDQQEWIVDHVQDKCRRACHIFSDQSNEPCEAAGPDASRTDLVIAYVWLLGDDENEIQRAAIDHLVLFCQILRPEFLFHYILNSVMVLFSPDPSQYALSGRVICNLVFCLGQILGIIPWLYSPEEQERAWDWVSDSFMYCWRTRLQFAEQSESRITDEFTFYVSTVLLFMCNYDESFLGLISTKVVSSGLLEFLVWAEGVILTGDFVKTLHEFLWKLFEEPQFGIEFGKVFIDYYPALMKAEVTGTELVFSKYQLASKFSAKIFGLPDLTQRLVKEMGLLTMLLTSLAETLKSYNSENGVEVIRVTCRLMDNILQVHQSGGYVHGRRRFLGLWAKNLQLLCGLNPPTQDMELLFYTWWCILCGWMTTEIRNSFSIG